MSLPATVRVNTTVNFPSLVFGTGPIKVTKNNGIWSIGADFSSVTFPALSAISLTLNPPALGAGLTVNQFVAGTYTPPLYLNLINVATDTAASSNHSGFVWGLRSSYKFGGSTMEGGRVALSGFISQNAVTASTNVQRNYVGTEGIAVTTTGDGGTNTGAGALGAYFGMNAQVLSSGPNVLGISGIEIDLYGTAAGTQKYNWAASAVSFNVNQGVSADAAFILYSGGASGIYGPGAGFRSGVLFAEIASSGLPPVDAAATLIGTHLETLGTFSAATGVDFTKFIFSGNAWQSHNYSVAQSGNVSIGPNTIADTVALSVVNQANAANVSPVAGPTNTLHIAGADGVPNQLVHDSFGGTNINLSRRANGTAAARTGMVASQNLFSFQGSGWTSAAAYSVTAVSISGAATETWSGAATGSQITFSTTPNTTVAVAIAMTIQNSGGVSIGVSAPDPGIGALLAADLYSNDAAFLIRTKTSLTNGAAAAAGTLTNAPAAGNPTKWFSIDDNGTTRRVPAW